MSATADNVYAMTQEPLDMVIPAAQQSFKVTSAKRTTPLHLEPRMKVKVTGIGYISGANLSFLEDENTGVMTVLLDEVELEEA